MLKLFSRLERTRSLVIVAFALLLGISLVLFYAPSRGGAVNPNQLENETLATVGSEKVVVGDMTNLKEMYTRMFGGQFSMAQLGGDKRLLDGLIRDRVVAQEAVRLSLAASDQEVADAIRKRYSDSNGSFVGVDKYKEQVESQYGSIERFEKQVRDSIAAEKLRAFVTAGASVSEEEVRDDWKRKNTTFELLYVPVTAAQLATRLNPSDQDLQAYYDAHKNEFQIPVPQKKIRYLFIDQAKAGAKLNISDEDLRREYDQLKPENKTAGARIRQIILRVARPDLDAQVKAKADGLVQQLRGGATEAGTPDTQVDENKFAEAARGNSEEPTTAKEGGMIAQVVRRNANKPDEPLQKALALQEGLITEPVKVGNSYYIFRRGADVAKSFEDAKPELLVSMRNRRGYGTAATVAARAADRFRESKDIQKVAQEFATEANMTAAEMIRETDFIKPGDNVDKIGSNPTFEQAIQPLNNDGDVGERTAITGGFAVPQLVAKRDPRVPEFNEVRGQIVERVKTEQANARTEQAANELAKANTPDELRAAAERLGLKAETSTDYKLGSALGTTATIPVAQEGAVYGLQAGNVLKTPIKTGANYTVIAATKRTDADLAEFAKQRDTLVEQSLTTRRAQIFDDYISTVQAGYDRDGKIKIYNDVLAQIAEDEPAVTPTLGGSSTTIPIQQP